MNKRTAFVVSDARGAYARASIGFALLTKTQQRQMRRLVVKDSSKICPRKKGLPRWRQRRGVIMSPMATATFFSTGALLQLTFQPCPFSSVLRKGIFFLCFYINSPLSRRKSTLRSCAGSVLSFSYRAGPGCSGEDLLSVWCCADPLHPRRSTLAGA